MGERERESHRGTPHVQLQSTVKRTIDIFIDWKASYKLGSILKWHLEPWQMANLSI